MVGRIAGSIAGFIMGMIIGSVFLGAGWLLKTLLSVPYGYSLAALTNGAVITVPTSIFIAWLRKVRKEQEDLDFRLVFLYYTLASLLGGLLGIGRWLLHIEVSMMASIYPLWDMLSSICTPIYYCGVAISIGVWLVSFGKSNSNILDMLQIIIGSVVMLVLVISLIALLADSPLWKVGLLSMLNRNVIGVTLAVTTSLGGLLGLCWPPVFQENA